MLYSNFKFPFNQRDLLFVVLLILSALTMMLLSCETPVKSEFEQYKMCSACLNPAKYESQKQGLRYIYNQSDLLAPDQHLTYSYFGFVPQNFIDHIDSRIQLLDNMCGVSFEKVPDNGDIRISADKNDGAWSYVGNTIFSSSLSGQATMNIGWIEPEKYQTESGKWLTSARVVDHELLHTLGFMHEQFNYNGGIRWDTTAVYNYFSKYGWDKGTIDRNVLNKYPADHFTVSQFDTLSIMLYYFPCELTLDGVGCGRHNKIMSYLDELGVLKNYPIIKDTVDVPVKEICFTMDEWTEIYNQKSNQ